ncbi:MAG: 2-hydroxyacid dehydrogenase [Rhodobiaceae bacterium]|nr:2-hydroxyacid dehydrogenase [Rhodobiaceae bacterium]
MSLPDLLQTGPMRAIVEETIKDAFTIHRLWEMEDKDAFLAEHGGKIKAVATGGHIRVDSALMQRLPNLKIVSNFGVGYDSVDAAWAGEHGIIVTNTPDVLTEEVADITLALLLMAARELGAAERHLRDGKWPSGDYPLTTTTLRGRSVGILGLGRIGKAVATRVEAFGLPVSYFGRTRQEGVSYPYYDSPVALAEAVDTLIIVLPGTAATRHLVNADVLKALGPDGIVVNIGRGPVIDEQALVKALQDGTIRSVGLDVFEHEPQVPAELIAMDRVVLLPHVGSASNHTRNQMGKLVADNLVAFAEGKPPLTPVAETPFKGW